MALPLILFDVNETLSDLGQMPQHFEEVGAPPQQAALWFASVLRDGFALTAGGRNAPFGEIAEDALRTVLAGQRLNRDIGDAVDHVMTSLKELPVHPDVVEGLRGLTGRGFELAALTNGAAGNAEALLERAGVRGDVGRVLSVEDAPRWKPAPESYAYALRELRREAGDVVLVAVHPWDIDGAARAGLRTVWLDRTGAPYPAVMTRPDHEASTLVELPDLLGG
ncbi:haloacid dehalogenase type II [Arthrobacter pityocampae]|nr:haloacid dehalogenase type II [Arthrobacter pityocampae]